MRRLSTFLSVSWAAAREPRGPVALLGACLCLLLAACQPGASGPSTVELHACRIHGIATEIQCGDLEVPEQRLPAGVAPTRTIRIHFAVIPAVARGQHRDPIFVIAGGPGQAATAVGGLIEPLFARLNRERSIVLIDQRGTGGSNPLACASGDDPAHPEDDLNQKIQVARLAHCALDLAARGNDLTQYTTPIAVQDIDAVRMALGYERINLWGASYGTRVELEYLRQYGMHVRTATLDGVAPATMKLPIVSSFNADDVLDRLIAACRSDDPCNRSVPNLGAHIDGLFARLAEGPIRTTVDLPLSGQPRTVDVTRALLASWVRGPLYSPMTSSLIPDLMVHAARDDFTPLLAASEAVTGDLTDTLSFGMHLSVICSEDMSVISTAEIASLERTRFGSAFFDEYRDLCAHWPRGRLTPTYFDPIQTGVAVLMLSGGLDPATPQQYAQGLLATMTNARHLVAPNVGHGVSLQGCAPDLIERFIRSADPSSIDGSCLNQIPRPPFFLTVPPHRS